MSKPRPKPRPKPKPKPQSEPSRRRRPAASAAIRNSARAARRAIFSRVSQVELCELTARERQQLLRWADMAMPRSADGSYSLYRILPWLVARWLDAARERAAGEETPQDRKARIQADKAEHELEILTGKYLPREEVERGRLARIDELTTGLDALAHKLPPLLYGKDPRAIQASIAEEIRRLRERFAGDGQ